MSQEATEQKQKKVLMIEDDLFLRKLYRDHLQHAGFLFSEATNGAEGIDKAIAEKPDVVILDLMIPIKNGFDVLATLSGMAETKDIPVVVVTNLAGVQDAQAAKELGAVDYLVKSDVVLSEMVEKIKSIVLNKKDLRFKI